jgi:FMN phosphatase YigB (HAD superfamily)
MPKAKALSREIVTQSQMAGLENERCSIALAISSAKKGGRCPRVPAALRKLRDAGFRLFTLTDNLLEVQTCQLEHGGIVDLFERRFQCGRSEASLRGLCLSRETAWG